MTKVFEACCYGVKWDHGTLQETLAEGRERIEREMISLALQHTDRNITRAAALLAISRRGIQMKIKKWKL